MKADSPAPASPAPTCICISGRDDYSPFHSSGCPRYLPPASDAPVPPREYALTEAEDAVAMIRRHLEYVCKAGSPLLVAWAQVEARLAIVAASPAQEATPPRWYGCEHRIGKEPCPDCAAPTPEATGAPRAHSDPPGGTTCVMDGYRAAPAREASTAPEPESFDDLLNRYGIACCDHGASAIGSEASEEAMERRHNLWQRLRATVAALTAERAQRHWSVGVAGCEEGCPACAASRALTAERGARAQAVPTWLTGPLTTEQQEGLSAFANTHGDYWLAALWRRVATLEARAERWEARADALWRIPATIRPLPDGHGRWYYGHAPAIDYATSWEAIDAFLATPAAPPSPGATP